MINRDFITGQILLTVLPQENGRYLCHILPNLTEENNVSEIVYGQTKEHSLAIALEKLAARYRALAEKIQGKDDLETSEQDNRYHVTVHYETVIEAPSKFEAQLHTLMGNTIVENAECTIIEISEEAQQELPDKRGAVNTGG